MSDEPKWGKDIQQAIGASDLEMKLLEQARENADAKFESANVEPTPEQRAGAIAREFRRLKLKFN